jgi:predicted nucleic acid-binding Zn ribbon protein
VSGDRSSDRAGEAPDEVSVTGFSTDGGGKLDQFVDVPPEEAREPDKLSRSSTAISGQPVENVAVSGDDASDDLTRTALAGARKMASGARRRREPGRGRRTRQENLAGRRPGGYSGPGPDPERDPQPIGAVLSGYVADRGWEQPLAQGRVFADWAALVGPDVAAHSAPVALNDGELRVTAESTAWATQLRLLASTLLARLVAELGPDIVTKLVITGPTGPSWKHGGRSVRGARGPRDTYG